MGDPWTWWECRCDLCADAFFPETDGGDLPAEPYCSEDADPSAAESCSFMAQQVIGAADERRQLEVVCGGAGLEWEEALVPIALELRTGAIGLDDVPGRLEASRIAFSGWSVGQDRIAEKTREALDAFVDRSRDSLSDCRYSRGGVSLAAAEEPPAANVAFVLIAP